MLTSGERADLEVVNGVVDRNGHAELHLQVLRPFGPASPRRRPVSRARVNVCVHHTEGGIAPAFEHLLARCRASGRHGRHFVCAPTRHSAAVDR